jgi:dTDP-4-amino-4,6-dideoxygalactose transaminase
MTSSPPATTVPFLDLPGSFAAIREDVLADLSDALGTCAFTNGPSVREFEDAFADYCGVGHCVGLGSGLDGLRLALQALDVGPGDEVLVPAMTFIATWEAVTQVGAVPVPVDVSPSDYNIDIAAAGDAVSARTRAIVPVHLYGQMADLRLLSRLAEKHGLAVVEDACQAHGASRGGIRAGSAGDAAAFSFYPSKNLGAMGDAGALVTSDSGLGNRVRALREHGQEEKNAHRWVGWTARLDTIQAAVLLRKLPLLDAWNVQRRAAAAWYAHALEGIGDLRLPGVAEDSAPVWHVYVVRTADPVGLARHLREGGIATGRHYPEPIHLSAAYHDLGYRPGAFPVTEDLARGCLSLPMFPGISESQLETVADGVRSWF